MYLDGGLKPPERMIEAWLEEHHRGLVETDHKSRLQEIMQRKHKIPPQYDLTKSTGPDHDKTFLVTVRMGKQVLGAGEETSPRKRAEQAAAGDALPARRSSKRKKLEKRRTREVHFHARLRLK